MENDEISVSGFIGKPVLSRGNRSYMICFVNGRYIKSPVINKAIEDAYDGFLMGHKYPFCVINIDIDSSKIDVNVHPSKQEIRFGNSDSVYSIIKRTIRETLNNIDIIPTNTFFKDRSDNSNTAKNKTSHVTTPEPFEKKRIQNISKSLDTLEIIKQLEDQTPEKRNNPFVSEQQTLFGDRKNFTPDHEKEKDSNIIGCVFQTYWIIEYHDEMYIMEK